jgi:hypothetical protein
MSLTPEDRKLIEGIKARLGGEPLRHGQALAPLCNYREVGEGKAAIKVGLAAAQIRETVLLHTGGWPKRIDERLFVVDAEGRPQWLLKTEELFAWLGGQFATSDASGIRWGQGEDRISPSVFAAHLRQNVERFDAIERLPHYPPISHCYYLPSPLPSSDGSALRELLARFHPATPADADLIHALFLTLFWGGAPGQRPAFLIDSEYDDVQRGRGIGKSKLMQAAARLAGGHIDARPGEDFDKLLTRLLSPAALDRRIATLDNVKTLRFSWADLEALVTADIISGRCLYIGEGWRLNTLTWIITLNGANLSRDMAQRCVPIRLRRPLHDPDWETKTWRLIDERRQTIIADIIDQLRQPTPSLPHYSRWSAWEQAVLAHVADPVAAQQQIEERQASMDDDQAEADLVRQAFVAELNRRGHLSEEEAVWIPSTTAAEIVNAATGERYPTRRASSFLATLPIPELRKCDYKGQRGWAWRGARATTDARLTDLQVMEAWPQTPFENERR